MAKIDEVHEGDKVTTNAEYDWWGTHLCSFVRETVYDVQQVGAESTDPKRYIVIGIGEKATGTNTTAAVDISTITVVKKKNDKKKTTKKAAPAKPKQKSTNDMINSIMGNLKDSLKKPSYATDRGGDGARKDTGIYQTESKEENLNSNLKAGREYERWVKETVEKIEIADPSIVQWKNNYDFPYIKRRPKDHFTNGYDKDDSYIYNYYMDYQKDVLSDNRTVMADMNEIYQSINTDVRGNNLYRRYTDSYNRYKIMYGDDFLSKTSSHVFFVKPDCNILSRVPNTSGSTVKYKMLKSLDNIPEFYYASRHCPDILSQLTQHTGSLSDFMMYLSNKARTFEISDEHIMSDVYGQGLTGYKIPYGKDNVASRTADKFTISYIDDRDLHVYHLHKLWIDYISYVYRGKLVPLDSYNINKVIDYATCVYYIVCAEDGETIIFWSKYWGVFPLDAPSSAFSYTADNPGGIAKPEVRVEYQYAWKEDFNPLSFIEFNSNTRIGKGSYQYTNVYQRSKLGTGYTWSPRPFIETYRKSSTNGAPYTFKLRFTPSAVARK